MLTLVIFQLLVRGSELKATEPLEPDFFRRAQPAGSVSIQVSESNIMPTVVHFHIFVASACYLPVTYYTCINDPAHSLISKHTHSIDDADSPGYKYN